MSPRRTLSESKKCTGIGWRVFDALVGRFRFVLKFAPGLLAIPLIRLEKMLTFIKENRLRQRWKRETCTVGLGYQKRFYESNNGTDSLDGPACSLLLFLLLLHCGVVLRLLVLQV